MKKILLCAAALALLAGPALAQQNGDRDHEGERGALRPGGVHANGNGNGNGNASHGNTNHGNTGAMSGPQSHAAAPPAAPQPAPQAGAHNDRGNDHRGGNNNQNNFQNHSQTGAGMAGPNNGMRGPSGNGTRNFGMSGPRRNAANFNQYHRNFTSPRRYRAPQRYVRPQGWYAHRWTYGERLPPAFFLRDYWIDDFADFGLVDPPYGTTWVRYGADAVLVDEETGEVIQVAYGVFY